MKKILIILFLSMIANATCIKMLEKSDVIKGKITINYCDNNHIQLILKNSNPYLEDFYITLSKREFQEFNKALHKTLSWFDKAKNNNIEITKKVYDYKNKLGIVFNSIDNGKIIYDLIVGIDTKISQGVFSVKGKNSLISFIKQVDYILKNGEKEFKKQTDLFK